MTTKKTIQINIEDLKNIMFSKEANLQAIKRMYKDGWEKMAERSRKSHNRICDIIENKENEISKAEVLE